MNGQWRGTAHTCVRDTYYYLSACPELMKHAVRRLEPRRGSRLMKHIPTLPALIERLFTERLTRQPRVGLHTIASYRDTLRLLLEIVHARLHRPPSSLDLQDLAAPTISVFLDDMARRRSVSVRTRNLRPTAICSFFRFTAFEEPAYSALIQRVLAIPSKEANRPPGGRVRLFPFKDEFQSASLLCANQG
jgi:hypothetical protein